MTVAVMKMRNNRCHDSGLVRVRKCAKVRESDNLDTAELRCRPQIPLDFYCETKHWTLLDVMYDTCLTQ